MAIRDNVQENIYLRRVFTCDAPECGKSYARREHLTRHKLNHNAASTFECGQCARQFVRKDLLVRHQLRHTSRLSKPRHGSAGASPQDQQTTRLYDGMSEDHSATEDLSMYHEGHTMQSRWPSGENNAVTAAIRHEDTLSQYLDPSSPSSMLPGDSSSFQIGESFPLFGEQTFFGNTDNISTTADLAQWLFSEQTVTHNETLCTPGSDLPVRNQESYPRQAAFQISDSKLLDMLSIVPHHLQSSPLLKTHNLSNALASYWTSFHSHYSILHHATFDVNSTPSMLLWAMIAIGSFYTPGSDNKSFHGTEALHAVMTSIMDALRWTIFSHPNFGPPISLWLLQSLIMLEVFEKFCSSRQMHERGHIFHAATITLMRRGSSLGPIFPQQEKSHDDYQDSLERAWHTFIARESAKRCAFLAFIIDTSSAMMFGHVQHMNPYEIKWPLPCSERLWSLNTAQNWSEYTQSKPKQDAEREFLSELKEILLIPAASAEFECERQGNRLRSRSPFAKIVLLYGLISVSHQLWQKQSSGLVTESSSLDGGGLPGEMRGPASRVPSKYDSTDPFPAQIRTFDYMKTIVKALKTWLSYSTEGSISQNEDFVAHYSLIYYYTMMSFNSDIIDLQIFAGSKRCLGRPVSDLDNQRIAQRIRSWAQSENAAQSVFHAVQVVRIYLEGKRRAGADKSLLNIWFLFHATLVCWAYGRVRQGVASMIDIEDRWQSAQNYLDRMNVTAQAIPFVCDLGKTRGLIEVVTRDFLCQSRWQLVCEAAPLLSSCVRDADHETEAG